MPESLSSNAVAFANRPSDVREKYGKNYWEDDRNLEGFAPLTAFFRLMGHYGFQWPGKRVLEVGFLHGADILHCGELGAVIFGIDINQKAVLRANRMALKFGRADSGAEGVVVGDARYGKLHVERLDLIYSIDVLNYFTDVEIIHFAQESFRCLASGGLCCAGFVHSDHDCNGPMAKNIGHETNPFAFLEPEHVKIIFEAAGFRQVATKHVLETYFTDEAFLRNNCYLLFKRP